MLTVHVRRLSSSRRPSSLACFELLPVVSLASNDYLYKMLGQSDDSTCSRRLSMRQLHSSFQPLLKLTPRPFRIRLASAPLHHLADQPHDDFRLPLLDLFDFGRVRLDDFKYEREERCC